MTGVLLLSTGDRKTAHWPLADVLLHRRKPTLRPTPSPPLMALAEPLARPRVESSIPSSRHFETTELSQERPSPPPKPPDPPNQISAPAASSRSINPAHHRLAQSAIVLDPNGTGRDSRCNADGGFQSHHHHLRRGLKDGESTPPPAPSPAQSSAPPTEKSSPPPSFPSRSRSFSTTALISDVTDLPLPLFPDPRYLPTVQLLSRTAALIQPVTSLDPNGTGSRWGLWCSHDFPSLIDGGLPSHHHL